MLRTFFVSLLKQFIIFLCYFILASAMLFNHQGGADIFFVFVIGTGIIIHLIFTIVLWARYDKEHIRKWRGTDFITLLIIIAVFIIAYSSYMDFMWKVTRKYG